MLFSRLPGYMHAYKTAGQTFQPGLEGTLITTLSSNLLYQQETKIHAMRSDCVETSDLEWWCQKMKWPARHWSLPFRVVLSFISYY